MYSYLFRRQTADIWKNKICAIRQKKVQEGIRSQEGGNVRRMTNFINCSSCQIFYYERDPVTEDETGG